MTQLKLAAFAVSHACAATTLALLLLPVRISAQELEPGAYWPLPAGLNIFTAVNSVNFGDLAFDPAAPIDEASATIDTTALAFTRAFSVLGRSANAGVVLPIIAGHLEGLYLGEPAEVSRFGLGDPRLRFAINLYGAPVVTITVQLKTDAINKSSKMIFQPTSTARRRRRDRPQPALGSGKALPP